MQYLEFLVGKQVYAISVLDVVSIEEMQEISDVPLPAEYVTGMVVIRDEVMQVYNLAGRLGIGNFEEYTDQKHGNMLLVVEHNKKRVAMEITMAKDIIDISEGELQSVPQSVMNDDNFIKGLIHHNDDLVAVIDHHRMFGLNTDMSFPNSILEENSKVKTDITLTQNEEIFTREHLILEDFCQEELVIPPFQEPFALYNFS